MNLVLQPIPGRFSICKVADYSQVNLDSAYCFTGRTDQEKSLVCLTGDVPGNTEVRDDGWRAFRIEGTLDFSLVGILSKLTTLLAEQSIGIFAISTYNTDYVLVKEENFAKSLQILPDAGYQIDSDT